MLFVKTLLIRRTARGTSEYMPNKEIPNEDRRSASFEELVHSNMLVNEALVGLLTKKGVFSRQEVINRIKKLRTETRVDRPIIRTGVVITSREDLVASNRFVVDLLLDLLVEKGFLTEDEMMVLMAKLKQRTKDLLRTQ
jgi:hypothetical protein